MRAVILAGGKGARLKPYTTVLPKPLVPINGEFPIIEIVIKQLKINGFNRITIAVGYLYEIIMAYCGDGEKWGVSIDYSIENSPLSTIGPLTLINDLPEHFLVMNGDILTDLNYMDIMKYHLEHGAEITIATYQRDVLIDYGVLEYEGNEITTFIEKPKLKYNVSMGVYCLNRSIIERLKPNMPYGFDDLMCESIKKKLKIKAYPYCGYWLDIGRPDDYDRANEEFERNRNIFIK